MLQFTDNTVAPLHPKNSLLLHLRLGRTTARDAFARPAFGQDVLQVLERALAEMSPTETPSVEGLVGPHAPGMPHAGRTTALRVQALKELNAAQRWWRSGQSARSSRLPMPACSPSWGEAHVFQVCNGLHKDGISTLRSEALKGVHARRCARPTSRLELSEGGLMA